MNQVTDALRAIDPVVWLRAALAEPDLTLARNVVFYSARFTTDYAYLKEHGFGDGARSGTR